MARGALSENERQCLDDGTKSPSDRLQDAEKSDCKTNGLRVRFLDEEGKTERTVSADEVDYAISRVKKIHILKNRSSSETSILLRNPSLLKRRSSSDRRFSDGLSDNLNNNSLSENLNGRISILKYSEFDKEDKTDSEQTKDAYQGQGYKKNCNVYSVNQAKTLTPQKKKTPLTMPRLIAHKQSDNGQNKSFIPDEAGLDVGIGKDFTSRAIGRLSRGIGKLLRRTNSVRISEPDPVYKVAYLGNVLTGWGRGESCIEKPLATLWRNYQQSTKPDVVMKLSVTNSGLKGFTKEHGLTEYWSHRVTFCNSPPHYPKIFCWVYRHEGKKFKHELRCHAVMCSKESVSKKITEELQIKLKQALMEFKKERISKQNARLSLANSVYDNPSMPRRKILLSVGSMNYRPPLERSKSAPKLGAIEELCSEEDEEEKEMNAQNSNWTIDKVELSQTLDRRRDLMSPRKMSCPDVIRMRSGLDSGNESNNELVDFISEESKKLSEASHECEVLAVITESNEVREGDGRVNYLVTDSDDGSVSSGCETASTVNSDAEPSSLLSQYHPDDPHKLDMNKAIERIQLDRISRSCSNSIHGEKNDPHEVNHIPIGEKNAFHRRSTYPPLGADSTILTFDSKFESLIENLTDVDSLNSSTETEVFKADKTGDNDSACSDESGYSELLDPGKDSIIGNTIMV